MFGSVGRTVKRVVKEDCSISAKVSQLIQQGDEEAFKLKKLYLAHQDAAKHKQEHFIKANR